MSSSAERGSNDRFTVREAEDDALEVMDGPVVVCTCWMEPGFAHDIARLLNADAPEHTQHQPED